MQKLSPAIVETRFTDIEASHKMRLNVHPGTSMELLLSQAVDDTLKMLGQRTSSLVSGYLEKRFGLKGDDILNNPQTFSRGLSNLFGSVSKSIELNIVKKFYSTLGVKFELIEGFNFADYVAALKAVI